MENTTEVEITPEVDFTREVDISRELDNLAESKKIIKGICSPIKFTKKSLVRYIFVKWIL